MITKKTVIWILVLSVLSIPIIFVLIPYLVLKPAWVITYDSNTASIGDSIGGIVGPIVGFVGIILTFLAFYIQYLANKVQMQSLTEQKDQSLKQERQILLQQFESIFFELLKLHRENVKEMSYRGENGRNVVTKIVNDFFEILERLKNTGIIRENKLDEQDLANISYLILYFGVDETMNDVLENRFFQKYSKIDKELFEFIESLRSLYNPRKETKKYYNGHQSRLGHYFRHLFRTVNFVDKNKILTNDEKKQYIGLLRAQFSTQEQTIIFFNSISDLGLDWELNRDSENDKLITKYNLIKNIPLGSIYGYNPKRYYPNLKLENDFEVKL